MTAADEAKHLDKVTDHVQDVELDTNKATKAMSALSIGKNNETKSNTNLVSKEDVDFIVNQLEVSEDVAKEALLRAVNRAVDSGNSEKKDGKEILGVALRDLIVS